MAGGKKGPNVKQEAGRAKKAENAAKKQAAIDQKKAAAEDAEWKKGANVKRASKEEEAARKADEAARKRREKAELLAAEEEEMGNSGAAKAKKALNAAKKKGKGKKKDDLAFLEDALQSAADKKSKKKKADQLANKQKQEAAAKSKESEAPLSPADPLLANTEQMIGNENDAQKVGRDANKARMEAAGNSGIEAALDSLNVTSTTPVKSAKALYAEFEERMMPQVKEDYPGLRLSQYKEKIYAMWKKSPENPANAIDSSTRK